MNTQYIPKEAGILYTPKEQICKPPKIPSIQYQLNELSEAVDALDKGMSVLCSAISPVLGPDRKDEPLNEMKEVEEQVPLAATIRTFKNRINSINRDLNDIINRVEL